MKYEEVEFTSEDTCLRGRLYLPGAETPTPAVVMAPGFGGLIQHSAIQFAEAFARAGLAALVYDNPCFGQSDGMPRQDVDPVRQRRAYRNAITYVQRRVEVQKDHIGIWGSSYSGGHVLEIAAYDRRVKCVVAQVPTISGSAQSIRRFSGDVRVDMQSRFDADRDARQQGKAHEVIPLVSVTASQPGYFNSPAAYDYYMIDGFVNEVTLRSVEMNWENEPAVHIGRISPTPLLMVVADNDEATPTELALSAYEQALQPKELTLISGGHFSPYQEHFEHTSQIAASFFKKHLAYR